MNDCMGLKRTEHDYIVAWQELILEWWGDAS